MLVLGSTSTFFSLQSTCVYGKTWFTQRDQGSNEYLVMALTADKRHQFDRDELYGDFAVYTGWQQSFKNGKLATYFMNPCGAMTVGANNTGCDVRSIDLGLSETFVGCAKLCPKYQDFLLDFDAYIAWDNFIQGLWTELRAPFVHTRWNTGLRTTVVRTGGQYYSTGSSDYWDWVVSAGQNDLIPVTYQGSSSCPLARALEGNLGFGDAPALNAGKISSCPRKTNGLADLRFTLGYDFAQLKRYNIGLGLDFVFPVGNQLDKNTCCQNMYLFDANVGGQHAYKIGGILRGQFNLCQNRQHSIDLYVDGRAYGVFGGHTTRMLGLNLGNRTCPSLFNQYVLLKKYNCFAATASYIGLERAANLLKARVTYAKPLTEAQVTASLQYRHNNVVGAIGYNFFGRSAECLKLTCMCNKLGQFEYAVIGAQEPVATQPNVDQEIFYDGGFYNPQDSAAGYTGVIVPGSQAIWGTIPSTLVQQYAVDFNSRINLASAAHPRYLSNTVFANLGYEWRDTTHTPYLGLIGKVDFGVDNSALTLWGVYLKGGLCF